MKHWNRILAVLLAALMLCASLTAAVAAGEGVVPEDDGLEINLDDGSTAEGSLSVPQGVELVLDGEIGLDDGLKLDGIIGLDGNLALEDGLNSDVLDGMESSQGDTASNSYTDGNYDHDAFEIDNGALVKYHGAGGDVVIPDGVARIEELAFYDCDELISVTIPGSVTSIGGWAFSDCDGLISVTIPDGVTSIGEYAFSYCENLTTVKIPSSVNFIGAGAFSFCNALKILYVSEDNPWYQSVASVVYTKGMDKLVCFPGSVPGYTVPEGVSVIGANAFQGCTNLANINLPSSLKKIEGHAFEYCNLTNVKIPNGVTEIGVYAFSDCDNLARIDIPYSVKEIGTGVFWGCDKLTSMNVWGDVNIPSSVSNIGFGAFYGCISMGSVTIPRSVKTIGEDAFKGCSSLTYVCIPTSVTYIGSDAFYGCAALKNITAFARTIDIDEGDYGTFEGCSNNLIVYAYENSDVFNWFKSRGFTVKKIPDYFVLLKGNTTKNVQLGDKVWIALDGPKAKSYASSNNNIATVSSNGEVKLIKAGTVKITVTMTTGAKWVLTLNVTDAAKLNKTSLSLKVGKTFTLKVSGLAGRQVTWSSSNKSVATVKNGKVTAKKGGKCTIYAQIKNGKKLKCTVNVYR